MSNFSENVAAAESVAEYAVDGGPDPLSALIDALPAAMYNKAQAAKSFNPVYRGIWEREAVAYASMGNNNKAGALALQVRGVNTRGWNDPDWAREILSAASNFDVDYVRELLQAGVKADQLYLCDCEGLWDIGTYAVQSFMLRAQVFPNAEALWADRCAQVVALAINAGGPALLGVWLDESAAPVLASKHLQGFDIKGSESYADLLNDLDLIESEANSETVAVMLLDQCGALRGGQPVWHGNPGAQLRLEVCIDCWFAAEEV